MTLKNRIEKLETNAKPLPGEEEIMEVQIVGGPDDGKILHMTRWDLNTQALIPPGEPGSYIIIGGD